MYSSDTTQNLPRPLSRAQGKQRLLLALSQSERDLFFPDFERQLTGLPEWQWCDTSAIFNGSWPQLLESLQPTILLSCWSTPSLPEGHDALEHLKYVCHLTGSIKHVVPRKMLADGLRVTNWGHLASNAVAEHALLLALAALRNLPNWGGPMKAGESEFRQAPDSLNTRTLSGKRVAIHGFGSVARSLIKLLRSFDVSITAYSSGVPQSYIEEHNVRATDSLADLFQDCEIFFECEALTEANRKSVTGALLRKLPFGAVFVNVGRGAVVDEETLGELADQGHLRVGLDVFACEPLPESSPLWNAPCAILSPHIGGPTRDQYTAFGQHALTNIRKYLRGESLESLIQLRQYDLST